MPKRKRAHPLDVMHRQRISYGDVGVCGKEVARDRLTHNWKEVNCSKCLKERKNYD